MAYFGLYGSLGISEAVLGLVTIGTAFWGIASIQSLYCRTKEKVQELKQETKKDVIRPSTHATINAILHTGASGCFIASDLYAYSAITPRVIVRVSANTLWFASSITHLALSRTHTRRQEDHPQEHIRPLGVHPSVYYLGCEVAWLCSGILTAASIWLESPTQPLRVAANICWLLSGLLEVYRTAQELETGAPDSAVDEEQGTSVSPQVSI